jgi:hypothetical protein
MWLYNGKEVTDEDVLGYVGFIYSITNLKNGKGYIGKKLLKFAKTKQVKGKKKKIKVDSDWKTYYSSSEALKKDVEDLGQENFRREILRFCSSKAECNYWELKYQIEKDVLLSDKFYNSWISARIYKTKALLGKEENNDFKD